MELLVGYSHSYQNLVSRPNYVSKVQRSGPVCHRSDFLSDSISGINLGNPTTDSRSGKIVINKLLSLVNFYTRNGINTTTTLSQKRVSIEFWR